MTDLIEIRGATAQDSLAISKIVRDAIRVSNSKDYPPIVIERVVANFTPEAVSRLMKSRTIWVALNDGIIVGTASLEGDTVRTVFVSPPAQGLGIGRRLMQTVETAARCKSVTMLRVPASLTARNFYARIGYSDVSEVFHGEERTFVMEKVLT